MLRKRHPRRSKHRRRLPPRRKRRSSERRRQVPAFDSLRSTPCEPEPRAPPRRIVARMRRRGRLGMRVAPVLERRSIGERVERPKVARSVRHGRRDLIVLAPPEAVQVCEIPRGPHALLVCCCRNRTSFALDVEVQAEAERAFAKLELRERRDARWTRDVRAVREAVRKGRLDFGRRVGRGRGLRGRGDRCGLLGRGGEWGRGRSTRKVSDREGGRVGGRRGRKCGSSREGGDGGSGRNVGFRAGGRACGEWMVLRLRNGDGTDGMRCGRRFDGGGKGREGGGVDDRSGGLAHEDGVLGCPGSGRRQCRCEYTSSALAATRRTKQAHLPAACGSA